MHEPQDPSPLANGRRDFVKKSLAVLTGVVITGVPVATGVVVTMDSLRRKGTGGQFIPVAGLEALTADGLPRKFSVIADKSDAWNKYPQVPIGAVYLIRHKDNPNQITAFNVKCPHAGCFVDAQSDGTFKCPCHDSEFNADGSIRPITRTGSKTVSSRGLDELEVDPAALKEGVIKVKFQNFLAGNHEKIPIP